MRGAGIPPEDRRPAWRMGVKGSGGGGAERWARRVAGRPAPRAGGTAPGAPGGAATSAPRLGARGNGPPAEGVVSLPDWRVRPLDGRRGWIGWRPRVNVGTYLLLTVPLVGGSLYLYDSLRGPAAPASETAPVATPPPREPVREV